MFYKEMIAKIGFVILALLTVPILFYSSNADVSIKEPLNWQASPKLINLIPFAVNLILSAPLRAMVSLSLYAIPYTLQAAISPPRMGAIQ